MKLFIDANIYLDYFRASSERLASLKALKNILTNKKIVLLIPEQTKYEYFRNRGKVVEETRIELVKQKESRGFDRQIPAIKDWKRAKVIKEKIKKVKEAYAKLLKEYDDKILNENTDTDLLIDEIFKLGENLVDDKDILEKAHVRYMRGNPPRKSRDDHSYGDAIIWELLLRDAHKDRSVIITHDKDFICTQKDEQVLNPFLAREWKEKKGHKIKLFISLGEFINFFEKKEVIKKEIVQEEKQIGREAMLSSFESVLAGGLYSSYAVDPHSTMFGENVLGSVVALDSYNRANNLKYCPYCGKDIEDFFNSRLGFSQHLLSAIRFTCPHCGITFPRERF